MWEWLIGSFSSALEFFHGVTGSYGAAIILLTLALRLAMWPLYQLQVNSARKMQALQPEMERLRRKYKGDQERLNQEIVKLWRKNRVNPAAGCFPMLVQLPFLWAIYQVLVKYKGFQGQEFLWVANLAAADRTLILPILAGVTTFCQSWLSMPRGQAGQQPAQQIMMWMMPAMIAFLTVSLPAGVALYWVVGNLVSIVQQWVGNVRPVALEGGKQGA